jgi:hypothetical protein
MPDEEGPGFIDPDSKISPNKTVRTDELGMPLYKNDTYYSRQKYCDEWGLYLQREDRRHKNQPLKRWLGQGLLSRMAK